MHAYQTYMQGYITGMQQKAVELQATLTSDTTNSSSPIVIEPPVKVEKSPFGEEAHNSFQGDDINSQLLKLRGIQDNWVKKSVEIKKKVNFTSGRKSKKE